MADELTKALLLEEVVSPSAVADALFASVTGGVPLVQALIDAGAATPDVIARYLSRSDAPYLRQISPVQELVERLPAGMCARLFAVPVRRDAITGTIDVAVADTSDTHGPLEISYHLRSPVRVVRASAAAIDEAVRRIRMRSLPPPSSRTSPSYPAPPQLAPPSENEPLYDSRPRSMPPQPRTNTLPPPVFERSPISVPPASPPAFPPNTHLGSPGRARRDTPTWGTPVHASAASARPDTEPPKSGLGSEIPIPLTRKTFAVERGGTQRPPPIARGYDALGEGIPVDPASYRTIVEVRAPDYSPESRPGPEHSFIPGPPPVPKAGTFAAYAPNVQAQSQSAANASIAGQPMHYADVGGILASLRIAQTRDEILELVLTAARMLAFKVALFVVKRGGYLGWACTPELGDRAALQNVLIPLETGSVFDIAVQEGLYLGPIRHDETHAALLHVMRGASRDVAVVPIRVAGKTAVIILADELGDTMIGTRRLEEIARAAGDAFARILKTRR